MHERSKEGALLNPDFRDMLSMFNEENVEYLVIGAYALGRVRPSSGHLRISICAPDALRTHTSLFDGNKAVTGASSMTAS